MPARSRVPVPTPVYCWLLGGPLVLVCDPPRRVADPILPLVGVQDPSWDYFLHGQFDALPFRNVSSFPWGGFAEDGVDPECPFQVRAEEHPPRRLLVEATVPHDFLDASWSGFDGADQGCGEARQFLVVEWVLPAVLEEDCSVHFLCDGGGEVAVPDEGGHVPFGPCEECEGRVLSELPVQHVVHFILDRGRAQFFPVLVHVLEEAEPFFQWERGPDALDEPVESSEVSCVLLHVDGDTVRHSCSSCSFAGRARVVRPPLARLLPSLGIVSVGAPQDPGAVLRASWALSQFFQWSALPSCLARFACCVLK